MATIHDQIDNYLAADLHNDLSEEERNALHTHLVECAACRQLHQENKIMNKILEEKFATEKPDTAFEQRMLSGFRDRIPQRSGNIMKLIVDLMRLRATQITAVAAILLALMQVGRLITGEGMFVSTAHEFAEEQSAAEPARLQMGALKKSDSHRDKVADRLAAGKPSSIAQDSAAPPPSQATAGLQPEFHEEAVAGGVKGAPIKSPQVARLSENQKTVPNEGAESAPVDTYRQEDSASSAALANRKLIRNAEVELEIASFDDAVQKITAFANEDRGYIATTSSEKQENGKLKGEVVVKVIPENLDRFLQKIRGLGELKNQTLGSEDVTKAYFDTDSRLKNARVMEQRLIDMLQKKSDDINDLLQLEKELGRVRQEIEQMQGELKFWDSQVQFATVTISLAEKDMEVPAAFLLKERAQLALYSPEVEKVYNDIKALASPKTQITNAQLDRDNSGRVSARVSMLIAPEESDAVIGKVKAMGRVENFQVQTERVAQGGAGILSFQKVRARCKAFPNASVSNQR